MPRLGQYLSLARLMGPKWAFFRASYAARRRLGFVRRSMPEVPWEAVSNPPLALHPSTIPRQLPPGWGDGCLGEAERILRGEFMLFSDRWVGAGSPPDWNRNHATGLSVPEGHHWADTDALHSGDIKEVWELSRFPWAFTLARAHARTGDRRFSEAFWRLFADWCLRNPANAGPNWACGQEAAFRLFSVVFASEVLGVPDQERVGLSRFIVATGTRILANLEYALSQKNNHGVSECVGLVTAALIVPKAAASSIWFARGMRELEAQVRELVYDDGGFAQHSLIYHRVLLHDLLWCRGRLASAGHLVPGWLDQAGRRALGFLMALVDPASGRAPLYGANDGANVLPLADASFLDMRPVVQAAAAAFRAELPLGEGPWDEAAYWIVGDPAVLQRVEWASPAPRWHARDSGCFLMSRGGDRLFLRCPRQFRHRPGQADMLHVDIWCDGRAIAQDGGTFSYNSRERFSSLGNAAQHNAVTVDGLEPMEKFGQFLYIPWPSGTAEDLGERGFGAGHDGYAKLGIQWKRIVSLRKTSGFVVLDRIAGAAGRRLRWHWRLADLPWIMSAEGSRVVAHCREGGYTVIWRAPAGCRSNLLRADPESSSGWWSPFYGAVEPVSSLLLEVDATGDIEFEMEFFRAN